MVIRYCKKGSKNHEKITVSISWTESEVDGRTDYGIFLQASVSSIVLVL